MKRVFLHWLYNTAPGLTLLTATGAIATAWTVEYIFNILEEITDGLSSLIIAYILDFLSYTAYDVISIITFIPEKVIDFLNGLYLYIIFGDFHKEIFSISAREYAELMLHIFYEITPAMSYPPEFTLNIFKIISFVKLPDLGYWYIILVSSPLLDFLPELVMLLAVVLIWFLVIWGYIKRDTKTIDYIAGTTVFIVFIIQSMVTFIIFYAGRGDSTNVYLFNNILEITIIERVLKLVTLFIFCLVFLFFGGVIENKKGPLGALILSSLWFILVLIDSHNFLVLFVSLESISFLLYTIAAVGGEDDAEGAAAALKYFFQGSIASILILAGITIMYISSHSFDFNTVAKDIHSNELNLVAAAGLIMVLLGFFFKIGVVPGHLWSQGTYQGVNFFVFVYFASFVKITIGLMVLKIYYKFLYNANHAFGYSTLSVITVSAMLLGVIGAIIVIWSSTNIRSFIAYTSMPQIGFVIIGILCNTLDGFRFAFFYLLGYIFLTLAFFTLTQGIYVKVNKDDTWKEVVTVSDLRNLFFDATKNFFLKRNVDTAKFLVRIHCLNITVWALAGIPPASVFYLKFAVWRELATTVLDNLSKGKSTEGYFRVENFTAYNVTLASVGIISVLVAVWTAFNYFEFLNISLFWNKFESSFGTKPYFVAVNTYYIRGIVVKFLLYFLISLLAFPEILNFSELTFENVELRLNEINEINENRNKNKDFLRIFNDVITIFLI